MKKIYLLNDLKFENIENLEIFEIKYFDLKIDLSDYDALLFTSKNAVYSLNHSNKVWFKKPAYAISEKTADAILKLKGNLVFTGQNGHGNEFAYELIEKLKNKKVLYVKALKTVSSISKILKENNIFLDELIAYQNICKQSQKELEKDSIFIFTSPSSIDCFFKNYNWDKSYKAIVIGKTTASYMPKDINFQISSKTSVEECIKLAFSL